MSGGAEFGEGGDRVLAGEYVLGVLDAGEMAAVRARARAEPGLRAEIAWWEAELAPLAGAVPPRPPPAALWDRLEAATAPLPIAANENVPRPRRVWPWQASTAAAVAVAAGVAAFAYLRPTSSAVRVAALLPIGERPAAFVAEARADGRMTLASLAPAAVPEGRSLELWVLSPGATKVAALGVLPAGGVTFDLGPPPPTGTQYLVSLEPTGGSPTGQPTGPVLYGGTFAGGSP